MDFARSLTFSFEDDEWITKYVIGSLMMVLGLVLPFIPTGYQVRVARNVIREKRHPLPGGGELGEVVADGVMALIAGLIYGLPVIVLGCCMGMAGGALGDSDLGGLLFSCFACCLVGFMFVFGLVGAAVYWMGVIRYAETGNFSEFLRFGSLWADVRAHTSTLLSLLVFTLIFGVLMLVIWPFSLITCVGPIVLIYYSQIVTGHMIGQAGLEIISQEEFGGLKSKRGS